MPPLEEADEAAIHPLPERVLGGLMRRLGASWSTLRNRRLAFGQEHCSVDLVLLHESYGIALIAVDRGEWIFPELGIRLTQDLLHQAGRDKRFPGHLPIIFVSVRKGRRAMVDEVLEAFAGEERIGIVDPRWVTWAAEVLTRETEASDPETVWTPEDMAAPATATAARPGGLMLSTIGLAAIGLVTMVTLSVVAVPLVWSNFAAPSPGTSVIYPAEGTATLPAAATTVAMPGRRLLTAESAAAYLGLDPAAFTAKYRELRAAGFPAPEPITGNFDQTAIDRWLDRQRERPDGVAGSSF